MHAGLISLHQLLRHAVASTRYSKALPSALRLSAHVRNASTKAQEEEKPEILVREKLQLQRPAVNKVKRPPFAKSLFLSVINIDFLDFPEILNNEQVPEVEECVKQLNHIFQEKGNPAETNKEGRVPGALLQDLKYLGLFGRLIPVEYGGLGLTATQYTRLNEVIGLDWSLAAVLGAHELMGSQAILFAGNDAQKAKYLPDLASGNRIAAFCSYESACGHDMTSIKTEAKWLPDAKCYSLSGTKSWVTNGEMADIFVVFSKVLQLSDLQEVTFACLVDRNSEGVKVTPMTDKSGLRGSGAAVVQFEDVLVPQENVLGQVGQGFSVLNKALESCRFGMSSVTFGALKALTDHVTEYVINTDRHEKPMADVPMVKETLSKLADRIYAMESVAYFTAGILDSTEDPDFIVESAICKVYNSESTLFCLQELMKLSGVLSLSNTHHLDRFYRDAMALASFDDPNDILRLLIGLTGLQYVGARHHEEIVQIRNPFYFPLKRVKEMIRAQRIAMGKIKYSQDVAGHLHPSLVLQGNQLEECVQKLGLAVDAVLSNYGQKVLEQQLDPVRLGNMLIDIYVSTAVLARSSRSYCIGLRHAFHEVRIAMSVCTDAYKRINTAFEEILAGYYSGDHMSMDTGKYMVSCKGYFPEHPLKHNF